MQLWYSHQASPRPAAKVDFMLLKSMAAQKDHMAQVRKCGVCRLKRHERMSGGVTGCLSGKCNRSQR